MKKVSPDELVNWWLKKYHNTSIKQIYEENPEWKEVNDKYSKHQEGIAVLAGENLDKILIRTGEITREFYNKYKVTQEQHDEWEAWAKKYTKKVTGIRGKVFDRSWSFLYLNVAPSIKKENG